jgi:hypothetical protein
MAVPSLVQFIDKSSSPITLIPAGVDNLLVLAVATNSQNGSLITAVNSGGVPASGYGSWKQAADGGNDVFNNHVGQWWAVTNAAGSPITIDASETVSGTTGGYFVFEFTAGVAVTWELIEAIDLYSASTADYLWPSLTTTGAGQVYVANGLGTVGAAGSGQTAGFIAPPQGTGSNHPVIYNASLAGSTAYAPTFPLASGTGATDCLGGIYGAVPKQKRARVTVTLAGRARVPVTLWGRATVTVTDHRGD